MDEITEEITAEKLKKPENKRFFAGYETCVEDLKNAFRNAFFEAFDDTIELTIDDDPEFGGFTVAYTQADYEKLSTLDKIRVELFVKTARSVLDEMVDSATECFDGLKEGEAD